MNVLLLVPQPFYIDRGSPIACHLLIKALSERGYQVDVITCHLGRDVQYSSGVKLFRTLKIPFIRQLKPGFSWQKLLCDFLMLLKSAAFLSRRKYHLIHAMEESVFIALLFKFIFKIPYIYDMDSLLSRQMLEKFPYLSPLISVLSFFEGLAVKNAVAVIPVCEAIAEDIMKYQPKRVQLLPDIPLTDTDLMPKSAQTTTK